MADEIRTTHTHNRTKNGPAGRLPKLAWFIAIGMMAGVALGTLVGSVLGDHSQFIAMGPGVGLAVSLALYFVLNPPKRIEINPPDSTDDANDRT